MATDASAAPAGWKQHSDRALGATISTPADWRVASDIDGVDGPNTPRGLVLYPPESLSEGTNLAAAQMWVESVVAKHCTPLLFDPEAKDVQTVKADGRTYTMSSLTTVDGGDTYAMQTYVVDGLKPCLAVKYFGRTADMHHFIPGEAKPYDLKQLWALFDT